MTPQRNPEMTPEQRLRAGWLAPRIKGNVAEAIEQSRQCARGAKKKCGITCAHTYRHELQRGRNRPATERCRTYSGLPSPPNALEEKKKKNESARETMKTPSGTFGQVDRHRRAVLGAGIRRLLLRNYANVAPRARVDDTAGN